LGEVESTALYGRSKVVRIVCTQCGLKGHAKEKCWTVIGYPCWYPKAKKFPQKKTERRLSYKGTPRGASKGKFTANIQSNRQSSEEMLPCLNQ